MVDQTPIRSPRLRLPPLGSLKAFEVAARHESLVRAAEELHVTHGAVSKQIRALEEEIGERLFDRRNRSVRLTERGRQFAGRLSMVFADLEDAVVDFRAHRSEQPLVVSCEPTLCLKLLIPNLPDLNHKTGLDVRVLAAGGKIDFRRDHIDLAVRRDDFRIDPGIHVQELAREAMGLVCAPQIAAKLALSEPGGTPALHTRSRPEAWPNWRKHPRPRLRIVGDVVYEHFYMAIEAALAGQGVALASIHMVAADLASCRLQALTAFEPDGTRYVVLTQRSLEDPRLKLFVDWLARTMEANLNTETQN